MQKLKICFLIFLILISDSRKCFADYYDNPLPSKIEAIGTYSAGNKDLGIDLFPETGSECPWIAAYKALIIVAGTLAPPFPGAIGGAIAGGVVGGSPGLFGTSDVAGISTFYIDGDKSIWVDHAKVSDYTGKYSVRICVSECSSKAITPMDQCYYVEDGADGTDVGFVDDNYKLTSKTKLFSTGSIGELTDGSASTTTTTSTTSSDTTTDADDSANHKSGYVFNLYSGQCPVEFQAQKTVDSRDACIAKLMSDDTDIINKNYYHGVAYAAENNCYLYAKKYFAKCSDSVMDCQCKKIDNDGNVTQEYDYDEMSDKSVKKATNKAKEALKEIYTAGGSCEFSTNYVPDKTKTYWGTKIDTKQKLCFSCYQEARKNLNKCLKASYDKGSGYGPDKSHSKAAKTLLDSMKTSVDTAKMSKFRKIQSMYGSGRYICGYFTKDNTEKRAGCKKLNSVEGPRPFPRIAFSIPETKSQLDKYLADPIASKFNLFFTYQGASLFSIQPFVSKFNDYKKSGCFGQSEVGEEHRGDFYNPSIYVQYGMNRQKIWFMNSDPGGDMAGKYISKSKICVHCDRKDGSVQKYDSLYNKVAGSWVKATDNEVEQKRSMISDWSMIYPIKLKYGVKNLTSSDPCAVTYNQQSEDDAVGICARMEHDKDMGRTYFVAYYVKNGSDLTSSFNADTFNSIAGGWLNGIVGGVIDAFAKTCEDWYFENFSVDKTDDAKTMILLGGVPRPVLKYNYYAAENLTKHPIKFSNSIATDVSAKAIIQIDPSVNEYFVLPDPASTTTVPLVKKVYFKDSAGEYTDNAYSIMDVNTEVFIPNIKSRLLGSTKDMETSSLGSFLSRDSSCAFLLNHKICIGPFLGVDCKMLLAGSSDIKKEIRNGTILTNADCNKIYSKISDQEVCYGQLKMFKTMYGVCKNYKRCPFDSTPEACSQSSGGGLDVKVDSSADKVYNYNWLDGFCVTQGVTMANFGDKGNVELYGKFGNVTRGNDNVVSFASKNGAPQISMRLTGAFGEGSDDLVIPGDSYFALNDDSDRSLYLDNLLKGVSEEDDSLISKYFGLNCTNSQCFFPKIAVRQKNIDDLGLCKTVKRQFEIEYGGSGGVGDSYTGAYRAGYLHYFYVPRGCSYMGLSLLGPGGKSEQFVNSSRMQFRWGEDMGGALEYGTKENLFDQMPYCKSRETWSFLCDWFGISCPCNAMEWAKYRFADNLDQFAGSGAGGGYVQGILNLDKLDSDHIGIIPGADLGPDKPLFVRWDETEADAFYDDIYTPVAKYPEYGYIYKSDNPDRWTFSNKIENRYQHSRVVVSYNVNSVPLVVEKKFKNEYGNDVDSKTEYRDSLKALLGDYYTERTGVSKIKGYFHYGSFFEVAKAEKGYSASAAGSNAIGGNAFYDDKYLINSNLCSSDAIPDLPKYPSTPTFKSYYEGYPAKGLEAYPNLEEAYQKYKNKETRDPCQQKGEYRFLCLSTNPVTKKCEACDSFDPSTGVCTSNPISKCQDDRKKYGIADHYESAKESYSSSTNMCSTWYMTLPVDDSAAADAAKDRVGLKKDNYNNGIKDLLGDNDNNIEYPGIRVADNAEAFSKLRCHEHRGNAINEPDNCGNPARFNKTTLNGKDYYDWCCENKTLAGCTNNCAVASGAGGGSSAEESVCLRDAVDDSGFNYSYFNQTHVDSFKCTGGDDFTKKNYNDNSDNSFCIYQVGTNDFNFYSDPTSKEMKSKKDCINARSKSRIDGVDQGRNYQWVQSAPAVAKHDGVEGCYLISGYKFYINSLMDSSGNIIKFNSPGVSSNDPDRNCAFQSFRNSNSTLCSGLYTKNPSLSAMGNSNVTVASYKFWGHGIKSGDDNKAGCFHLNPSTWKWEFYSQYTTSSACLALDDCSNNGACYQWIDTKPGGRVWCETASYGCGDPSKQCYQWLSGGWNTEFIYDQAVKDVDIEKFIDHSVCRVYPKSDPTQFVDYDNLDKTDCYAKDGCNGGLGDDGENSCARWVSDQTDLTDTSVDWSDINVKYIKDTNGSYFVLPSLSDGTILMFVDDADPSVYKFMKTTGDKVLDRSKMVEYTMGITKSYDYLWNTSGGIYNNTDAPFTANSYGSTYVDDNDSDGYKDENTYACFSATANADGGLSSYTSPSKNKDYITCKALNLSSSNSSFDVKDVMMNAVWLNKRNFTYCSDPDFSSKSYCPYAISRITRSCYTKDSNGAWQRNDNTSYDSCKTADSTGSCSSSATKLKNQCARWARNNPMIYWRREVKRAAKSATWCCLNNKCMSEIPIYKNILAKRKIIDEYNDIAAVNYQNELNSYNGKYKTAMAKFFSGEMTCGSDGKQSCGDAVKAVKGLCLLSVKGENGDTRWVASEDSNIADYEGSYHSSDRHYRYADGGGNAMYKVHRIIGDYECSDAQCLARHKDSVEYKMTKKYCGAPASILPGGDQYDKDNTHANYFTPIDSTLSLNSVFDTGGELEKMILRLNRRFHKNIIDNCCSDKNDSAYSLDLSKNQLIAANIFPGSGGCVSDHDDYDSGREYYSAGDTKYYQDDQNSDSGDGGLFGGGQYESWGGNGWAKLEIPKVEYDALGLHPVLDSYGNKKLSPSGSRDLDCVPKCPRAFVKRGNFICEYSSGDPTLFYETPSGTTSYPLKCFLNMYDPLGEIPSALSLSTLSCDDLDGISSQDDLRYCMKNKSLKSGFAFVKKSYRNRICLFTSCSAGNLGARYGDLCSGIYPDDDKFYAFGASFFKNNSNASDVSRYCSRSLEEGKDYYAWKGLDSGLYGLTCDDHGNWIGSSGGVVEYACPAVSDKYEDYFPDSLKKGFAQYRKGTGVDDGGEQLFFYDTMTIEPGRAVGSKYRCNPFGIFKPDVSTTKQRYFSDSASLSTASGMKVESGTYGSIGDFYYP